MPKPITGLTGIAGFQSTELADQATPEQRLGNVADPRHGNIGQQARPYPWEARATQAAAMHGPYGPENQLLDDIDEWVLTPAGMATEDPDFDHTPSTRAAPWPKGILSGPIPGENPDALAEQRIQSYAIHGTDRGASRRMQHNPAPRQDEWAELWEVNSGSSDQQAIPRQMMSSGFMWGTRDRVQSMARQNEFGFDSKHMHRRYATGSIPGNTDWMRPGGRPMSKTLPGPARPAVGPDSPFAGDDLGRSFSPNGAVLQTVPSEYTPPPTPTLTGAVVADVNDSVVEWY